MHLSTRPITNDDVDLVIGYWLSADEAFLSGMGADINKIPSHEEWEKMLKEQIAAPLEQKQSYCIIWLNENIPVGHSNVNKIRFGNDAYMHLHLWQPDNRKKNMGTELVKKTIPWFFNDLQLKILFCEPYALNPAPNRTLEKAGFKFVKEYVTIPGYLNFEQPVKLWKLNKEDLLKL